MTSAAQSQDTQMAIASKKSFSAAAPRPVAVAASGETLPEAVDAVVIGGGIIGVCAAYRLARRGISVALVEKGAIAGEQSSRNWGYCRQQGRDVRELPLAVEALRQWRTLSEEIGADTGFRQSGLLYVTHDEAKAARWEAFAEAAREFQVGSQVLSGSEVAAMLPGAGAGAGERWRAGLWTDSDGRAEPPVAAPAIAEAAKRYGAKVFPCCAARGLEMEGGRVAGVVTERGRIRASRVLLAGGAWSRLFAKRHGLTLKSLNVRASVMRTGRAPEVVKGGICGDNFALRRRLDGGYTVANPGATTYDVVPDGVRWMRDFWPAYRAERATMRVRFGANTWAELAQPRSWSLDEPSPFEAVRSLDPQPDRGVLAAAMRQVRASFPVLRDVEIAHAWAGMIDATPDAVPIVSEVETHPGLIVATGFSGHGFGIGPGAGRLAAELMAGATPCVDPAPFRLDRFSPGTAQPQSGI